MVVSLSSTRRGAVEIARQMTMLLPKANNSSRTPSLTRRSAWPSSRPDGHWLRVNRALCEMLTFTFRQIVHFDDLMKVEKSFEQMTHTEIDLYHGEVRFRHQRNREVWTHLSSFLIRSGQAQPLHFIAHIQDITKRKQTEGDIGIAHDAALESARLKSEFLGNMSHEIRTPINGVVGMTGLLMDTPLTDEQHEYTEAIRTSANGLITIINDILDFSKFEAGKLAIEHLPFDLISPPLKVPWNCSPRRPIHGGSSYPAPSRRTRPFVCMAISAGYAKSSPTSSATPSSSRTAARCSSASPRRPRPAHDVTLHFSIKDTGIGIREDSRHLIFHPFTQADGSRVNTAAAASASPSPSASSS